MFSDRVTAVFAEMISFFIISENGKMNF